jgi:hypothetical protein
MKTEYILQRQIDSGKWIETRFNAWMSEADIREYFQKHCTPNFYRMIERITSGKEVSERVLPPPPDTERSEVDG